MVYKLIRTKSFPAVHVLENAFKLSADSTLTTKNGTIYPVIMQDEAQGDPNSLYTNPESASFAEVGQPNTYPDSRVNYARVNIEMALTKACWDTDKVEVLKVMVVPIYTSFLENLTALNDVTSEEVEDILSLQHETTDRQCYPLFNGTDLAGHAKTLGTDVPGLTTDQTIEGVNFNLNRLYDALQFYKNAGKLRNSIGKIRWVNISRRKNFRMSFRIKPKSKAQNPYTFFGVLIYVPPEGSINQMVSSGDTTAIDHLNIKVTARYNEWNDNFNFMR